MTDLVKFEKDLHQVLKAVCPRVFSRPAPFNTPRPYVIWESVGGIPQRYLDNTANARHSVIQVTCWDDTVLGCRALIRAVEIALCAAVQFQASPQSEVIAADNGGLDDRFGDRQDFEILSRI